MTVSIGNTSTISTSTVNDARPKRILVVGGGPTGLVALRNLQERGAFEEVQLVERRDDVGGVWYLDDPILPSDTGVHNHGKIKTTKVINNGVTALDGGSKGTAANGSSSLPPRWPSPAYPGLIGNVLPEFLSYSHYPFPELPRAHQPFPTLAETHCYLKDFAAPLISSGSVRLNTEVCAVEELPGGVGWRVRMKDWRPGQDGRAFEELWDAVVVANGWYDTPVWPQTPGLEKITALGLAKHAKGYRGPKRYEGKRCLVVGNANSSNDIAALLRSVGSLPIYQSIRRPAFPGFPYVPDEHITMVAPVAEYIPTAIGQVEVHLTDGTVLPDIDAVFIGTGYKPHPHFVHVINPDTGVLQPLMDDVTGPPRIPSLHKHIMYAHNPTLGFVGAPMSYTPFTLADVSSTWLALAWSGDLEYPDTAERRLEYERARVDAIEEQRREDSNVTAFVSYMVLAATEQDYARGLVDEVVRARPSLLGVLPEWSDEKTKKREAMWPVKLEALVWARGHGSYGNASLDGFTLEEPCGKSYRSCCFCC